jgi:HPr kinase/phosphorylase
MSTDASVGTLFDTLQHKLGLKWAGSRRGEGRPIKNPDFAITGTALVGHLNLIRPNRVQILGAAELQHLERLDETARRELINQIFSDTTDLIVIGDGQPVPDAIRQRSEAGSIPLLSSDQPTAQLVSYLQYYLTTLFAEKIILHGVFLEVFSVGLLITGDPSVGKSELALDLITRGSRLVADDAPEFTRIAPDFVSGTCPPLLREFLEVRGLGILNIRAMFGDSSIKRTKYLRLIVHLVRMSANEISSMDRLSGAYTTRDVLGVSTPQVTVPVAPGRNLAVLVESAVRNHLLRLKGYDATEVLIERQQQVILEQQ